MDLILIMEAEIVVHTDIGTHWKRMTLTRIASLYHLKPAPLPFTQGKSLREAEITALSLFDHGQQAAGESSTSRTLSVQSQSNFQAVIGLFFFHSSHTIQRPDNDTQSILLDRAAVGELVVHCQRD